ncbi:MAG: hypothetical protein U0800_27970 [Isosphaeraceae bacterium]
MNARPITAAASVGPDDGVPVPLAEARALDRYSGVERINFLVARTMLRLGLKGELLEQFVRRRWEDVRDGRIHPDDLVAAIDLAPAYIDPEYHPARLLGYAIELLGRARKEGRR